MTVVHPVLRLHQGSGGGKEKTNQWAIFSG